MATYGYKPSGAAHDLAYFGGGDVPEQLIAYIPDPMSENGWGYSMTIRTGPATAGSRDIQGVIYSTTPNPTTKAGETEEFTASTVMNSGGTGAAHTVDLLDAVKMRSNFSYALGADSEDGRTGLGMIAAGSWPDHDNYLFYYDTDSSLPPPTTFTTDRTSYEGHLAIAVNYEPNVAPDVPRTSSLSPPDGSNQSSLTPVFTAEFRDDNETLPNGLDADTMQSFVITVRRSSDNHLMWSFDELSTPDERTARAFSRTYEGETLVAGITYKWKAKTRDQFGAESGETPYQTFTVGASYVDVSTGTPTGKQETQTMSFTGIWHHTSLNAKSARVRIRNRVTGAIYRDMGTASVTLSPNVAPNGVATVTWAQIIAAAPTWTNLAWGTDLTYEMQLRDTANNWSGWSSPTRDFKINAVPSTPTLVTPVNGEIWSTRPKLTVKSTDPDDTVATGFVVKGYVKQLSTSTTRGPYSFTLRAGTTDTWDLQTTATHLPAVSDYQWWTYSGDGTIWSGKQTLEANAALSAVGSFTYALGPTVTVTSPVDASVIATDTPHFEWTTPGSTQNAFRVLVWDRDTQKEIYDTNYILSAAQSWDFPDDLDLLKNGGHYQGRVYVQDTLTLTGSSGWIAFDLVYPEPVAIDGVSASLIYAEGDVDPTVTLLQWNTPVVPAGATYLWTRITRVPTDDTPISVDDRDRETRQVQVARIYDISVTRFEDHRAPTGQTLIYRVRAYFRQGSDQMGSPVTSAVIRLDFNQGILQQVPDTGYVPEHRVVLQYRGDLRVPLKTNKTRWRPMNKAKSLVFAGKQFERELSGTFKLHGLDQQDIEAQVRELQYMAAMPNILHWKDGQGRSMYCIMDQPVEISPPGGRIRQFEFTLLEVDYPEIYL